MLGISGSNKLCITGNDLEEIRILGLPFWLLIVHIKPNLLFNTLTRRLTSSQVKEFVDK